MSDRPEQAGEEAKAGFSSADQMSQLGEEGLDTQEHADEQGESRVDAIPLEPNEKGFQRGDFVDRNGRKCSIQESSVDGAIWLGVDVELKGNEVTDRMHLSRGQAAALLPHLQKFVETGDLS